MAKTSTSAAEKLRDANMELTGILYHLEGAVKSGNLKGINSTSKPIPTLIRELHDALKSMSTVQKTLATSNIKLDY